MAVRLFGVCGGSLCGDCIRVCSQMASGGLDLIVSGISLYLDQKTRCALG